MQKTLLTKTLLVFGLMLVLYIPLQMIQTTISERIHFRTEAVHSIAADSVQEQTVIGPLLVIPYTDEYEEKEDIPDTKPLQTRIVQRKQNKQLLVFPNELRIDGDMGLALRLQEVLAAYNSAKQA